MKIVPCLSATIAVLLMICGGIGFFIVHNFLGVRHPQNYFVVAACFLLISIFWVLMSDSCCKEKEKK